MLRLLPCNDALLGFQYERRKISAREESSWSLPPV